MSKARVTLNFRVSQEEYFAKFSEKNNPLFESKSKNDIIWIDNRSAILKFNGDKEGFYSQRKNLMQKSPLSTEKMEPVLIYEDGTKQISNGQINLKLKPEVSINEIIKKWKFQTSINEWNKNIFLLTSNQYNTEEIFSIVNELQNNDKVIFAEPNFIKLIKPFTSDPYFSNQWSIKNNGNEGGISGADMKVEPAWQYSTGSGIKVAIIDEGVDLGHPDLKSNLLAGYDATGRGSNGGPEGNDSHGTACAGIVAAVGNNTIGVVGVAYNAKILPVRIGYGAVGRWVYQDSWAANGINWAWRNGADVLSNSWGGGSYSNMVADAINDASTKGRSGKGAVVLFASGNGNQNSVHFPSSLANAICVGATSMCDQRKNPNSCDGESWWGSNYGSDLDVVAPGVRVYTTDISGLAGNNSSDYIPNFNGTSSACPNAAGVVALILSIKSSLTQKQARDILEKSADKVRQDLYYYQYQNGRYNGAWDSQMGYGRINALNAVQQASSWNNGNELDPIIFPTAMHSTSYQYKVVSEGNHPNSYQIMQLRSGGIEENMGQMKIQNSQKYHIKIVNTLGHVVMSKSGNQFDITNLPTETYFVQIFLENTLVASQTIVKK